MALILDLVCFILVLEREYVTLQDNVCPAVQGVVGDLFIDTLSEESRQERVISQ